MSVQKITKIRQFLLDKKLLDSGLFESDTILTARSIQFRFQAAKKPGKRPVTAEERFWLLDENETEAFVKIRPAEDNSGKNTDKSCKNAAGSRKNAIKKSKENEKEDDEHGCESGSHFSPEAEELFGFFEEIYYRLNNVQKTWVNGYIDTYGLDNVYEALEETGRRNVKDPIAYMRKVLRTLQLEGEED